LWLYLLWPASNCGYFGNNQLCVYMALGVGGQTFQTILTCKEA